MKTLLLLGLTAALVTANEIAVSPELERTPMSERSPDAEQDAAQPKLLRIAGMIDGSGRFIFTREGVRYEHKHWRVPEDVTIDGEPWTDLSHTPPAWREIASRLDLTRAYIFRREGRDVIALEQTADGFDLYLADSPNGAAKYEVTIAIPRRR
jgi:hypothetical protein